MHDDVLGCGGIGQNGSPPTGARPAGPFQAAHSRAGSQPARDRPPTSLRASMERLEAGEGIELASLVPASDVQVVRPATRQFAAHICTRNHGDTRGQVEPQQEC